MDHESNVNAAQSCDEFQFCKFCLAEVKEDSKMKFDDSDDLLVHISYFSDVQMYSTDKSPPRLCWKCWMLVKKFIKFRKLCIQSAAVLSNYYSSKSPQAIEIIKKGRESLKQFSFSISNTVVTEYVPNDDAIEEFVFLNNELAPCDTKYNSDVSTQAENIKQLDIKQESKIEVEPWFHMENDQSIYNEQLMLDNDAHSTDDDIKVAVKQNQLKEKKTKVEIAVPKECGVSQIASDSPAKSLDMSMVIRSSLTEEEQIQEMEDVRNSEDYMNAPYKCQRCAKWFVHEIVHKDHLLKHDAVSGPFVCETCGQHFSSSRNMKNHRETHSQRYSCLMCGKVLISKQSMASHMYTEHHHADMQVSCHVCHKTFKNKLTYMKHRRVHNNSKDYKCHLCPKVFSWKGNLNHHLTRHKNVRPFSCLQCVKTFYLKENLKDHMLIHTGVKKFYCVECDLSYASQAKLNQHLKRGARHLTPDQLTFACKLCDVRYTTSVRLSIHMDRVHLNKRSHACLQCECTYLSKNSLQTHIRVVHNGVRRPRDQVCETCGKAFSNKRILEAHIRTHTGEKPFSCKYCGIKFAHSGAMYTHVRLVHLNIKRTKGKKADKKQNRNKQSNAND